MDQKPAPAPSPNHKCTFEVNYGFINIVCPFWERVSAKVIWHHATVGSQTDEESFWKKKKNEELLNVYLFTLAL